MEKLNSYLEEPSKNVMVDIETLDKIPNAVILYITAVHFDIETREIYDYIEIPVSINSCLKYDMSLNEETCLIWMNARGEVKDKVINSEKKYDIKQALSLFQDFINNLFDKRNKEIIRVSELNIWAKDPRFDLAIIRNAINKTSSDDIFWNLRKERSVRTIIGFDEVLAQGIKDHYSASHDPYYDCVAQIEMISKILNNIHYA